MKNVAAPSDLASRSLGGAVLVGGRARHVREGSRATIHLFDAFASVPTDLDAAALEEGALAVVEATFADQAGVPALVGARIVSSQAAASSLTDVARILDRGIGRMLERRSRAIAIVREYFGSQGFLEVETPALLPSPGLDLHLGAFEVPLASGSRFLSTSPEYQMKRLLVGGIPRCFQLARAFRRDESGRHHNAEFTMLEWYRSFAGVDAVIDDTEELVARVLGGLGSPPAGLDLRRPFERLTVARAFEELAGIAEPTMLHLASHDPEAFFRAMVEHVEPAIAARGRPVVLHRYPRPMASLARLCPDDDRYAERFEVYAAGLELCNGFGELTDANEQRERFERDRADRSAAGLPIYPLDERFLGALAEGMPPSAGNALGFDRLVMLATGAGSIEDVMAFPTNEL